LAHELGTSIRCRNAILDGELRCLESDGRASFDDLLFRRKQPYFYAFDLLALNGRDLRGLPLLERNRRHVGAWERSHQWAMYRRSRTQTW
jgi:bifunctional non-homologous end joining protein LigD